MTMLATCKNPSFDISRMELDRSGPSFTIETAMALRAICPSEADISFIIGADALEGISSWKDAPKLLGMCQFIVVPRPGYDRDKSLLKIEQLTKTHNGRFRWLDIPTLDISSTEIRERFKTRQPLRGLIPKVVEDYAIMHKLYPEDVPFTKATMAERYEDAVLQLKVRLSPKRFTHTMGVVKEAEKLALHYGVGVESARWAALLHDCAKEYSAEKKRALCEIWSIELDELQAADIDITHGILSAESARRDFRIFDEGILQAIRYHTTGHKSLSLLDKVIMLADYIEPNRDNWEPLQEMRRLAMENINKALIVGTKATIQERKDAGKPVHPLSLDALKTLKKSRRKANG